MNSFTSWNRAIKTFLTTGTETTPRRWWYCQVGKVRSYHSGWCVGWWNDEPGIRHPITSQSCIARCGGWLDLSQQHGSHGWFPDGEHFRGELPAMEMEPLVKLRLIVVFCIGFIHMCSSESCLIIQQHRAVSCRRGFTSFTCQVLEQRSRN